MVGSWQTGVSALHGGHHQVVHTRVDSPSPWKRGPPRTGSLLLRGTTIVQRRTSLLRNTS